VLLEATCCLLLIACLNVANLLVARAAARRKELAIRTALGGGWLRLIGERLMECLLLSASGGVLGLARLRRAAVAARNSLRHEPRRVHPHRRGGGGVYGRRYRNMRAVFRTYRCVQQQ
jgi:hypothetical protein